MKHRILLSLLLIVTTLSSFSQQFKHRNHESFLHINNDVLKKQLKNEKDNLIDALKLFSKQNAKKNSLLNANDSAILRLDSNVVAGNFKLSYNYDDNGGIIQETGCSWNSEESTWDNVLKVEYTYDDNVILTQNIFHFWDINENTWVAFRKEMYTYDEYGNIIQCDNYTWNSVENTWIISRKTEYKYNSSGNMEQYIQYFWDSSENTWNTYWKEEFKYNTDEEIEQSIAYNWNNDENDWVASMKNELTYDSNGNVEHLIAYNWDSDDNIWVAYMKLEYTFDINYTADDLIVPYYYTHKHKLLTVKMFDFDIASEEWVFDLEYVFYYFDLTTTLQFSEADKVSIYPNPASDYLKINNTNGQSFVLEIFDLQGRKVLQSQITNGEVIIVSHLNSGLYIYNIYDEEQKQNGKIIKK